MAFGDSNSTTSEEASAVTTHSVSLPASTSGDLLCVVFGVDTDADIVATPSGWSEQREHAIGGVLGIRMHFFYKRADGSEGSTLTITTSVAQVSRHVSLVLDSAEIFSSTADDTDNTLLMEHGFAVWPSEDTTPLNAFIVGYCCWESANSLVSFPSAYPNDNVESVGVGVSVCLARSNIATAVPSPKEFDKNDFSEWLAGGVMFVEFAEPTPVDPVPVGITVPIEPVVTLRATAVKPPLIDETLEPNVRIGIGSFPQELNISVTLEEPSVTVEIIKSRAANIEAVLPTPTISVDAFVTKRVAIQQTLEAPSVRINAQEVSLVPVIADTLNPSPIVSATRVSRATFSETLPAPSAITEVRTGKHCCCKDCTTPPLIVCELDASRNLVYSVTGATVAQYYTPETGVFVDLPLDSSGNGSGTLLGPFTTISLHASNECGSSNCYHSCSVGSCQIVTQPGIGNLFTWFVNDNGFSSDIERITINGNDVEEPFSGSQASGVHEFECPDVEEHVLEVFYECGLSISCSVETPCKNVLARLSVLTENIQDTYYRECRKAVLTAVGNKNFEKYELSGFGALADGYVLSPECRLEGRIDDVGTFVWDQYAEWRTPGIFGADYFYRVRFEGQMYLLWDAINHSWRLFAEGTETFSSDDPDPFKNGSTTGGNYAIPCRWSWNRAGVGKGPIGLCGTNDTPSTVDGPVPSIREAEIPGIWQMGYFSTPGPECNPLLTLDFFQGQFPLWKGDVVYG